jgi:hypothetical protein
MASAIKVEPKPDTGINAAITPLWADAGVSLTTQSYLTQSPCWLAGVEGRKQQLKQESANPNPNATAEGAFREGGAD